MYAIWLINAANTFQRTMDTGLSGIQGFKTFIYIHDLVIHTHSMEDHSTIKKLLKNVDR